MPKDIRPVSELKRRVNEALILSVERVFIPADTVEYLVNELPNVQQIVDNIALKVAAASSALNLLALINRWCRLHLRAVVVGRLKRYRLRSHRYLSTLLSPNESSSAATEWFAYLCLHSKDEPESGIVGIQPAGMLFPFTSS